MRYQECPRNRGLACCRRLFEQRLRDAENLMIVLNFCNGDVLNINPYVIQETPVPENQWSAIFHLNPEFKQIKISELTDVSRKVYSHYKATKITTLRNYNCPFGN